MGARYRKTEGLAAPYAPARRGPSFYIYLPPGLLATIRIPPAAPSVLGAAGGHVMRFSKPLSIIWPAGSPDLASRLWMNKSSQARSRLSVIQPAGGCHKRADSIVQVEVTPYQAQARPPPASIVSLGTCTAQQQGRGGWEEEKAFPDIRPAAGDVCLRRRPLPARRDIGLQKTDWLSGWAGSVGYWYAEKQGRPDPLIRRA